MNDHAVVARADRVSRRFEVRGERVLALDEVTVDVPRGRLLAIAGPSGSGKSTLLAELGALDRPTTGTVTIGDRDITALGRRARRSIRRTQVATVLPQPSDNLLVRRSGVHNLRVAMRQRGGMASWVQRVIDDVEIGDFVDRVAGTMSSAWRWPARWWAAHRWCWPTSPPARSTT
jgi:putative ABC transport system ATP-binding protein